MFTIAKKWKWYKCLTIGEWTKCGMIYSYKGMNYQYMLLTTINLENIVPSERCQSQEPHIIGSIYIKCLE